MGNLLSSCANVREPIELSFGVVSGVGGGMVVLDGGSTCPKGRAVSRSSVPTSYGSSQIYNIDIPVRYDCRNMFHTRRWELGRRSAIYYSLITDVWQVLAWQQTAIAAFCAIRIVCASEL